MSSQQKSVSDIIYDIIARLGSPDLWLTRAHIHFIFDGCNYSVCSLQSKSHFRASLIDRALNANNIKYHEIGVWPISHTFPKECKEMVPSVVQFKKMYAVFCSVDMLHEIAKKEIQSEFSLTYHHGEGGGYSDLVHNGTRERFYAVDSFESMFGCVDHPFAAATIRSPTSDFLVVQNVFSHDLQPHNMKEISEAL